jgi:hypothetical protein
VRQRIPMTLLLAAGAGPCGVATNDGDEMWSAGECKNEDMWPHPKSTVAMAEIATAARSDVPTGCFRDDKERRVSTDRVRCARYRRSIPAW